MTDQAPMEQVIQRIAAALEEQARWQRLIGLRVGREVLIGALGSDQLRLAYSLCDGEHTLRQIASEVGVALGTVSNWTRKWRDLGVAYENANGRMCYLIPHESLVVPPAAPET
jgi:hypothetical protein